MAILTNLTQTETLHRDTILQGDCLDILPTLAARSVDFILTDPPYITRYKSRDGRRVPNDNNDRWLKPAFAEMHRVLANDSFCVSFYGWPQADKFLQAYRAAGFRVVGHFAFPKRYTSASRFVRYQHECAHLLVKGNPRCPEDTIGDVIDWTYSGNKLHPTQKPLSVLLPLVETFAPPRERYSIRSADQGLHCLRPKRSTAPISVSSWMRPTMPSPLGVSRETPSETAL